MLSVVLLDMRYSQLIELLRFRRKWLTLASYKILNATLDHRQSMLNVALLVDERAFAISHYVYIQCLVHAPRHMANALFIGILSLQ